MRVALLVVMALVGHGLADLTAYDACMDQFKAAGEDCAALPAFLLCHADAKTSMTEDEVVQTDAAMQGIQVQLKCNDVDTTVSPQVKTVDENINFQVGPGKDFRFRRANVETVSVYDLKNKMDKIESTIDAKLEDSRKAVEGSLQGNGFATSTDVKDKIDLVLKVVDGKVEGVEKFVADKETQLQALQKETTDRVEAEIKTNKDTTDKAIADLKATVEGSRDQAHDGLDQAEKEFTNKVNKFFQDSDAKLKTFNDNLNKAIDDVKKNAGDKVDKLTDCVTKGGYIKDGNCVPRPVPTLATAKCDASLDGTIRASKYNKEKETESALQVCQFNAETKKYEWASFHVAPKLHYSCWEIKKADPNAEDGIYTIQIDGDQRDLNKVVPTGKLVKVYCLMDYDVGGLTLWEMTASNQWHNTPFGFWNHNNDYLPGGDIGTMWKRNQNQPARLARDTVNSIFKHSRGYVQMRYANNRPGYQLTEVYGTPENGRHILSNKCSHKNEFNIALAFRGHGGNTMGFCFRNGRRDHGSNCICGDGRHGRFNQCPGGAGNRRRYNAFKSNSRWCSHMHTKCYPVDNHWIFGDSYSCDMSGQRHVGGHMWKFYHGSRGVPCSNYGGYNCYGSTWIG